MKSSLRLGTVRGIGIFTHWTFLVMLVGLFVFYIYQGLTVVAALAGVALITTVFGCVVLHELGHAFMARHYGIPTLDITMYPIGGVARLARMPREPIAAGHRRIHALRACQPRCSPHTQSAARLARSHAESRSGVSPAHLRIRA